MPTVISVAPEGPAWAVRCAALFDNVIIHKSGGRAEAAARGLAERLSQAGVDCLLEVRLRDGALAGRFVAPARSATMNALGQAA
ncbi:hypothetical protein [Caulobacter hibisci]|uniref:Uncharacterized protein n=1 Tax=Caulobacter hibisci TaxID=2035993 RepID=A0ABS0SWQ4_9CAUL|nr:hypothetical protein [Caulobacter hibisci]MBI1684072.1 hypothetical protein [Caulobacter hibisci]